MVWPPARLRFRGKPGESRQTVFTEGLIYTVLLAKETILYPLSIFISKDITHAFFTLYQGTTS